MNGGSCVVYDRFRDTFMPANMRGDTLFKTFTDRSSRYGTGHLHLMSPFVDMPKQKLNLPKFLPFLKNESRAPTLQPILPRPVEF